MINSNIIIGICPICDREMWEGKFVDKHHFYPKCMGGKDTEWLHKICHRKIHSVFTEKELALVYNNPNVIINHVEFVKFRKWISKKSPDFFDRNDTHSRKR